MWVDLGANYAASRWEIGTKVNNVDEEGHTTVTAFIFDVVGERMAQAVQVGGLKEIQLVGYLIASAMAWWA
jgi:hypothetical protein